MSSLLPIFNDEDFVPHAYLDALFQQLGKNHDGIDLTSLNDLNKLQSTSLSLLNQLDYLTKEVTSELEENVQNLENTNSIISYSYQSSNSSKEVNVDSKLKPTSRLEYYIDSLSIGIDSLNQEVSIINQKLESVSEKDDGNKSVSKVQNLLTLSKSKENLQQVLKALNTIKSIIDIAQTLDESSNSENNTTTNIRSAPTSSKNTKNINNDDDELIKVIKPNEFQLAINVLKETIIDQFNNKLNNESIEIIDFEFLKKINDLIKISEVFKNFNKFNSIYHNFINFLQTEKKNYLNSKKIDDNDELFKEILE